MKSYHPDRLEADKTASGFALDLNQSYEILRDPAKRAEYDDQIRNQQRFDRRRLASLKSGPSGPSGALAAGLAVAGIASLAIALAHSDGEFGQPIGFEHFGSIRTDERLESESLSRTPLPKASEARALAQHSLRLSHGEAEKFSRKCFARASADTTLSVAQSCILFDIASLYWRLPPEAHKLGHVYFSKEVTSQRHLDQMAPFGLQADSRLAQLRQMAFAAAMQMVQQDQKVEVSRANLLDSREGDALNNLKGGGSLRSIMGQRLDQTDERLDFPHRGQ